MTKLANSCLRHRFYWRSFWAAMWMAHLPASWQAAAGVLGIADGPPDWGRFLLLSASNVFFLLEVCFAPSLRLVSNRRAMVVFLLIVAIMHSGMIEQSLPGLIFARDAHLWLAVTAGAVLARNWLLRAVAAVAARRLVVDFLTALWKTTRRRFHSTIDRGRRLVDPVACFLAAPRIAPPTI